MLDEKVKGLFRDQSEYWSLEEQSAVYSPLVALFLNWAKDRKPKHKIRVCEFGGAAGQLLASIKKKYSNVDLYNIEIIREYEKALVDKKITFIHGSLLNSKLSDRSFDCLIIRDVLHHLIGKNLASTRKNQKKALKELKRLTKKNGIILIEELITSSAISSAVLYHLAKFFSRIGFKCETLAITPNTVVSFLTAHELERMVYKTFGSSKIAERSLKPWNEEFKARLMHLGAKNWKMFFLVKM